MSGMSGESVGRSDGRSEKQSLGRADGPSDSPAEWSGRARPDRPTDRLTDRPTDRPTEPVIIAESPAMRRAVDLARRLAPLDLPVMLVGETGTGKEVLAQAIHGWSGRPGELVDVDCGALPPGMAVAELFGHRKGAYTTAVDSMPGLLERANRGTLFLDELASLSAEGQAALLRVLETGEVRRVGSLSKTQVSIRVIAAVQETPDGQGDTRHLRPDLHQRLAGGVIYLPPIRDRTEDLWPLAVRFAGQLGRSLTESVRQLLDNHHWPGNVRELRNVMARASFLTEQGELDPATIAEAIDAGLSRWERRAASQITREAKARLELLCREHDGDADAMAAALGVSRATLYRRLRQIGLRLR